jgi:hypothetical protein
MVEKAHRRGLRDRRGLRASLHYCGCAQALSSVLAMVAMEAEHPYFHLAAKLGHEQQWAMSALLVNVQATRCELMAEEQEDQMMMKS